MSSSQILFFAVFCKCIPSVFLRKHVRDETACFDGSLIKKKKIRRIHNQFNARLNPIKIFRSFKSVFPACMIKLIHKNINEVNMGRKCIIGNEF